MERATGGMILKPLTRTTSSKTTSSKTEFAILLLLLLFNRSAHSAGPRRWDTSMYRPTGARCTFHVYLFRDFCVDNEPTKYYKRQHHSRQPVHFRMEIGLAVERGASKSRKHFVFRWFWRVPSSNMILEHAKTMEGCTFSKFAPTFDQSVINISILGFKIEA